jgi:hypothetical protein
MMDKIMHLQLLLQHWLQGWGYRILSSDHAMTGLGMTTM